MGERPDTEHMRGVTIQIPDKETVERNPALHEGEERRAISLQDGPAVAFTSSEVRIYDSEYDEFVPLDNSELVELLAAAYGFSGTEKR
jgi:hypothetical protein